MGLAVPLALAPQLEVSVYAAERIITETTEEVGTMVDVQELHAEGDILSGTLVNQTADALRNVRLTVTDNFLWQDLRHPGSDNPSRAAQFLVAGPIPPRGTLPFSYRRASSLPNRADGRFQTAVSVTSVTKPPVVAPE